MQGASGSNIENATNISHQISRSTNVNDDANHELIRFKYVALVKKPNLSVNTYRNKQVNVINITVIYILHLNITILV